MKLQAYTYIEKCLRMTASKRHTMKVEKKAQNFVFIINGPLY